MSVFFRASAPIFGLLLCACTTTTIKPSVATAPSEEYFTVAVGDITTDDPLWESRLIFLRHALVEQLRQEEHITDVLDPAPEPLPTGAILVTGTLTEVEKGNRALRALIGFGAGRAYANGEFDLHDDEGSRLVSFQSRKAYSGGFGIGGFDLVDIDELMEKLGQETGKTIGRWVRGEGLEPPSADDG